MSKQRNHRDREIKRGIGNSPTTEGLTETAKMQYENIPSHSTLDECLFKETILPSDTAQTLSGRAIEMKVEEVEETAKTEYEKHSCSSMLRDPTEVRECLST